MKRNNTLKDGKGARFRSVLIFLSYYLFFTLADLSVSLEKYQSLLSPHLNAYAIWLLIYVVQFGFVSYQLLKRDARANRLVNRKLVVPYILHQFLFAAWLRLFEAEWVVASAAIYFALWCMTFICYILITSEFRAGDFTGYRLQSWMMIEIPFAITLGWETYSLLINANSAVMVLSSRTTLLPPALELASFMITLLIVIQAAVLFAGLSILMNPFLHSGLVWGSGCTAYRLLTTSDISSDQPSIVPAAAGLAAAFTSALCFVYLCVSLVIMAQSQFCLPDEEGDGEDEEPAPAPAPHRHVCRPASLPAPITQSCAIPVMARGSQRRMHNISLPAPPTNM